MIQTITRTFLTGMIILALTWACFLVEGLPVLAQEDDQAETGQEVVVEPGVDLPGEAAGPEAAFTEASPFDNLAVALVIDVSGSMSYTDPLRLREAAAGMFIDLIGSEDYLSVITFDHEAELIKPLEPVGSPADKAALMNKLSPKLDPRGDTDFVTALELARRQFAETDTGDKVPVIMLLTDGEPDPYPGAMADEEFMAEYMELLWEEVGLLADEGILIYNVAFSDEIDPEVIRRISTETRGLYYIMADPGDLLVAFYQALEALKDRRSFLEETVDLGSGGTHTFSFDVEEHIRQLNLVLVGDAAVEGGLDVVVTPPRGSAGDVDQLLVSGRESYQAVILSRPGEEQYGRWEVEVSGSGEIAALGNADLYLEAILIDPVPSASYPLNEPMDIRVEMIAREDYADAVFHLDLQVTGPDGATPVNIPLVREGNSFHGVFEEADQIGDYELSWQVYRGADLLFSNTAAVEVRQLPLITSDFFVDAEGFRLGEEMVVSSSLTRDARRIQEGPTLQVESFDLDLEYRDGARINLPLFDSGDRDHGNSRAGDGIWSNRLLFDREGSATATLTATGEYQGAEFILKRSFGFSVAEAGRVAVSVLPEELWAQPGRSLEVPLQIDSQSPFTQTLRISTPTENVELVQDRVTVPPGENATAMLDTVVGEGAGFGSFYITLDLEAEDGMTPVEPEAVDFEVMLLTRGEAFQRQYSGLGMTAGIAGVSAVLFGVILFGGGSLLHSAYLKPRLRLKGYLVFHPEGDNPGHGGEKTRQVDLGQAGKPKVVLSFNSANQRADFIIVDDSYNHDLVISNSWHDNLPRFLRGWKALLTRTLAVETTLKATPPGIIESGGSVQTTIELHPDDVFSTGSFTFHYQKGRQAGTSVNGKGKDILNGKM